MDKINFDNTPSRSERNKIRNQEILNMIKMKDVKENRLSNIKEHAKLVSNKNMDENFDYYNKGKNSKKFLSKKLSDFSLKLKESLLVSALNVTFDNIAKNKQYTVHEQNIGHSMIEKFVSEMGVDNLISTIGRKNLILSEYSAIINDTYKTMMNEVSKKLADNNEYGVDDDSTYIPDKCEGKKFIDNVMSCTPGKVPIIVQDRVQKSVQDFVDQNVKNKETIKDIYQKAKEKIEKPGNDKYQEEITAKAKKDVLAVYESKTNLFGMMVRLNSKSIIKDENLKNHYMLESSKLDYKSILKDSVVMYTVLEMVNTLGLITPDKKFISNILKDLQE